METHTLQPPRPKPESGLETYVPLLVSKRQAAGLLSLCLRSIDNLIAAKQLPCRRIGKRVLIPYSALVAFARRDHPHATETKTARKQEI
jgi:excisionase family DNA binding protein